MEKNIKNNINNKYAAGRGDTMEIVERRYKILKILCRRKQEKIGNLAHELGVSERTIRRDIDALSLEEPIFTERGRYGSGVYLMNHFSMMRMYMSEQELCVLRKLCDMAEKREECVLTDNELNLLEDIVIDYTRPSKKGNKKLI